MEALPGSDSEATPLYNRSYRERRILHGHREEGIYRIRMAGPLFHRLFIDSHGPK